MLVSVQNRALFRDESSSDHVSVTPPGEELGGVPSPYMERQLTNMKLAVVLGEAREPHLRAGEYAT